MNQVLLSKSEGHAPEDGMLFVRTLGILTTLVQAPLIALGIIMVVITIPVQQSSGLVRNLDLIIYPDGTTHVFSEISVDPLEPDSTVELLGTSIDNFVAEDENGFLLSGQIEGETVILETLGASKISIDYDVHDLVSKQGRIWSFNIDAPTAYTLLMPRNIVIVGMSTYPFDMQITEEQTQLSLPDGPAEINYFFGVSNSMLTPSSESEFNYYPFFIGGAIAIVGVVASVLLKRVKRRSAAKMRVTEQHLEVSEQPLDVETIFRHKPDLREDDKELINFISENGGQAYESELRKKFLQPRTTMWRAVKRLERYGIVEIEKKELQNLVKLKKKLEDEK